MIKTGISWLNNPFKVMRQAHARSGISFYLKLPQLGKVLITGDPSHIKQFINSEQFDAGAGVRALSHLLGSRSVICLDGQLHHKRHQMLIEYFYSDKIYSFDDSLHIACQEALSKVEVNTTFNFYSFSQAILLDVGIAQLLGDVEPSLREELKSTLQAIHATKIHPMSLFIKPLQFKLWGLCAWGKLLKHQQELRKLLHKTIKNHRVHGDDLLSFLLSQHSKAYESEQDLIDELMALLFFSHETTAASIAATADNMLRHKETREAAKDIEFINACVKEGMRLKPVVPHLTRICRHDIRLNDHRLQKGQWVFPSSYLAHFNPDIFPEPEKFKPERFSSGKSYPYHSFPFGLGKRMCIGKRLAERHMEIILHEIFTALTFAKLESACPESQKKLVLMLPGKLDAAIVTSNTWKVKFSRTTKLAIDNCEELA